jgi:methylated-DNA-[protein]-cysteine S-methyltransferase
MPRTEEGFALFDTALGLCGIAWSRAGVRCVWLPDAEPELTRVGLLRHLSEGALEQPPPAPIADGCARITALLAGAPSDLTPIALDMAGVPPFHQRVYDIARAIPPGATRSYGEVAKALGQPGAARAVGQALGHNPFAIVVPCHRVLAAHGKAGGFTAHGGAATKLRILAIERRAADTLPLFAHATPPHPEEPSP